MMRNAVRFSALAAAAVLVAGCGPYHRYLTERACEDAVRNRMKAPASTQFVASELIMDGDIFDWLITYDSVNSYNAPMRGQARCQASMFQGAAHVDRLNLLD